MTIATQLNAVCDKLQLYRSLSFPLQSFLAFHSRVMQLSNLVAIMNPEFIFVRCHLTKMAEMAQGFTHEGIIEICVQLKVAGIGFLRAQKRE